MPGMTSEEFARGVEFEASARKHRLAEDARWEWYRIGQKVMKLRRQDDGTLQKRSGVPAKGRVIPVTVCFSCRAYIADGHGEEQDCAECKAAHERSRKFWGY